jgi:PAS domain S-box-containing protein
MPKQKLDNSLSKKTIAPSCKHLDEKLKFSELRYRRLLETAQNGIMDLEKLSKTHEETMQALLNVMEDLEEAKNRIEIEKVKDEAMFASIGEGLIAADNEGKITTVNKAAENMLGWKKKELIGKKITTLPLEDEEGNSVPLKKRPTAIAISTKKVINVSYFFVKRDNTRFPIAINVTPLVLGGKTIGSIETLRNITQEKEIDRAKTEFVSLASHQLRTPLGISKWYIEALKGEGYLTNIPEIAKDYFNEIYKSNQRLLSLVRDLLSVARINQGKVRDAPKLVNIIELISDVLKEMNILATKDDIHLNLHVQEKHISLFIDPLRLQEVIENLIGNAISYSKAHGKIEIMVNKKNDKIIITVKDAGIGISSKDKKMLFTKFFRSEKASTKNVEGSGLGLYVVKSYIDGWNGDINVISEEGKGSTFTVTLPIIIKKIQ